MKFVAGTMSDFYVDRLQDTLEFVQCCRWVNLLWRRWAGVVLWACGSWVVRTGLGWWLMMNVV